jgi:hypothetical protein
MADKGADGYSLQETIDGQSVTYDRQGDIISRTFTPDAEGPVQELLLRRAGEHEARVEHVNTQGANRVHVMVRGPEGICNYFISTLTLEWERVCRGTHARGRIGELEIRWERSGEPWQQVQWVTDGPRIVLQAVGSTCTYRFNRLTQRWERVCS